MYNIIRVFPRRTSYTPTDEYAFVGDPPLVRPEARDVHVSVTFTWDIPEAERLAQAWSQYYQYVSIGGPAIGHYTYDKFEPSVYVKEGVTFTTRGCNKWCPWCLVPRREGKLRALNFKPGYIIQDNNLLQASKYHIRDVFTMLQRQKKAARFVGGLDATLIDNWVAGHLAELRIGEVFLAADTDSSLKPLEKAVSKLQFLSQRQLRCYVLLGFAGQTIEEAQRRLEKVWEVGCLPFAQLYQPPDRWIDYPKEWKDLARTWSRPAAMFAIHKEE